MAIRCPKCGSEEFFVVVEHQWSFKVNNIGLSDVTPGEKHDSCAGWSLVCDECQFNGWIEEYHHIKNGIIPVDTEEEEEFEEYDDYDDEEDFE